MITPEDLDDVASLAEAALHHANMEQPKEEEEPTDAAPAIQ